MAAAGLVADARYYVTSPLLWPLVLGLRALGMDTDPLLIRSGIALDSLKNPDSRLPATAGLALMREAIAESGDPNLGLKLSQLYRPGMFTVLDYLAHSSATLREAIERNCRYEGIHQNAVETTLAIDADSARATLRQHKLMPADMPRHVAENSLANLLIIGRQLTGRALIPHEVCFTHAEPADTREHARVFGCPLRFGAEHDALVFDVSWLSLPLPNANRALCDTLEWHARELLKKLAQDANANPTIERVRKAIAERLPDAIVTIDRIARALDTSSRTLQRRLSAEGTSLAEVLQELRIELALRYLAEPDLGIEDVALMLGFSDSRAFRRAFKRWRGITPAEHRARSTPRAH